ncbi:hypothetical protein PTSG_01240 [Salpingoeca rosetta]|uniref:Uncharacterized protein n=1 Tax=Salpingoeca rosetta (strain ATCC 50818 / BSB-021) TaxID=946362 RepID=F2U178_SALR5|nr:uncharacterized protein PTSG_01240 [Salpingoeca rosetta]EGD80652.1 hypothetical protein PTSG_01240 [Salpingoeca rosetta]|eukprot:XP_004997213.1 hypothetical protein PTSG_01240 [Salpingoeca rosetta]
MKLNADLILMSPQFTNPLKQRELDLRGNKIQVIENLGATLDQFDTIDFSDNDIRSLDGFPHLKRLNTLLLNNNRILRVAPKLSEMLPNLEAVVLTNNSIAELGDLEPFFSCKKINHLTLLRNPVAAQDNYRLFVIYHMPNLKVLDFARVREEERTQAQRLFGSEDGQAMLKDILSHAARHEAEAVLAEQEKQRKEAAAKAKAAAAKKIQAAIAQAGSLEEIQKLEAQLQAGVVPGQAEEDAATEQA